MNSDKGALTSLHADSLLFTRDRLLSDEFVVNSRYTEPSEYADGSFLEHDRESWSHSDRCSSV